MLLQYKEGEIILSFTIALEVNFEGSVRQIPGSLIDIVDDSLQNHRRRSYSTNHRTLQCLEIVWRGLCYLQRYSIVISKAPRVKNLPILLKTDEANIHNSIVADLAGSEPRMDSL